MIKYAPLNLYKPLKRSQELTNDLPTHQGTGGGPRERSESRLWKVDFWIFDIFTKLEKILRPPKSKSQKFPSFLGFSERIPKRLKIEENVYLLGKKLYRYQNQKFCKISDFGSKSGFSILWEMVPTKIWTTQNRNHNFLSRFWAFRIV